MLNAPRLLVIFADLFQKDSVFSLVVDFSRISVRSVQQVFVEHLLFTTRDALLI